MADEAVIYTADHVLEYPFVRSVGPVVGAFLTGLRDGKVVGTRGTRRTGHRAADRVRPRDGGGDRPTWSRSGPRARSPRGPGWRSPRPKHPLQTPFAWVLVRFDGADTSFLHVLPAASPDEVSTGMRVRPEFAPEDERVGHVKDISHFVAVGGAS